MPTSRERMQCVACNVSSWLETSEGFEVHRDIRLPLYAECSLGGAAISGTEHSQDHRSSRPKTRFANKILNRQPSIVEGRAKTPVAG